MLISKKSFEEYVVSNLSFSFSKEEERIERITKAFWEMISLKITNKKLQLRGRRKKKSVTKRQI